MCQFRRSYDENNIIRTASAIVLLAMGCYAQKASRIEGVVFGASDAPLPNATVRLVEKTSRQARTVVARGTGVYAFENVGAGTYSVTVASVPGFETKTIVVGANGVENVDLRMAIHFKVDDKFAKPTPLTVGEMAPTPVKGAAFEVTDTCTAVIPATSPARLLPT